MSAPASASPSPEWRGAVAAHRAGSDGNLTGGLQYAYRSACICYFSGIPAPGSIAGQRDAPVPPARRRPVRLHRAGIPTA